MEAKKKTAKPKSKAAKKKSNVPECETGMKPTPSKGPRKTNKVDRITPSTCSRIETIKDAMALGISVDEL